MNKFKPTYLFNSVDDIPQSFFALEKISCVLLDIDNTLVPDNDPYPDERAREFIKRLRGENLDIFLISNNKKIRVDSFNEEFKLPFIYRARKPFAYKINRLLRENNIDKKEVVFIGDQLLTDILAGNNGGIRTILVNPINVQKENLFFKGKRMIENKLLKRESL